MSTQLYNVQHTSRLGRGGCPETHPKPTRLYTNRMTYTDIDLPTLETLRQQPGAVVVDVRDEWEYDEFNLGGLNLPLPDLRARRAELLSHDPILLLCSNGTRSRVAAKDLLRHPEFSQKTIYHLAGGLLGVE